jgi:hypothetical protein
MPTGKQDIAERDRLDDTLNEGLEETFRASDALSITQPLQSNREHQLYRDGYIPFRDETRPYVIKADADFESAGPHDKRLFAYVLVLHSSKHNARPA